MFCFLRFRLRLQNITPAMSTNTIRVPPTPAPTLTAVFILLFGVGADVTGGNVFAGTPSDRVGPGPIVNDSAVDVDDCVVLILVDGPTDADNSVNSAVCVLQHLLLSASLSQQNFASLAKPSDPHCHTWTPEARKSYAVVLMGVSWLSWHCCGHRGLAQLLSVHVPRA
jgi:hypothetical protein